MIDAILRSSALLVAGCTLAGLFASRSAALRHWILAASVLGAAAVVPLSLAAPAWTIAVPSFASPNAVIPAGALPAPAPAPSAAMTSPPLPPAASRTRVPLLPLLWGSGCLALLAILVIGLIRMAVVSGRAPAITDDRWRGMAHTIAARYGIRRAIALIEVDAGFVPATWGIRRPRVLLPRRARDWDDDRMQAVLNHELAHVARADWLVQTTVHAAVAVLWFNPLAWIAATALRRAAEQACDDRVLAHGIPATDYARHLVALARDGQRAAWTWMPALLMVRPSTFERRIAAMLNPSLDRRPVTRRAASVLAATAMAITLAAGTLRAVQAPGELSGTVYDPSGGVIPGMTLALSDAAQRTSAEVTTDNAGHFSFPNVAPGRYVLSAALPGFHQLHEEFDLKTAADWNRAVTLQVGTLRETINVSATRTLPAPPAGPTRIRVGGNIRVPRKVQDVHPIYPDSMRAEGREADVQLEATIGRDGSVSTVRVLSAQIHPDFAIAAADAVRQWRFTPTLLNGQAVDVVMTVTVHFSLSN